MNTRHQQRGIGMQSLIVFLVIGGFFLWIFFKLFIPMTTYLKVRNAMDSALAQPEVAKQSTGDIRKAMLNRLRIDDVDFVDSNNFKEFFAITRKDGKVIISGKHQTEIPLFNGVLGQDILFLVRFDQTAESP